MLEKVIAYIEKNCLLSNGDGIVVGVSGGADSVCLLLILAELRKRFSLQLVAVHVHHGIRGEEADGDADFVKNLANKLDIDFIVKQKDVPIIAKTRGLSEEEAGRIVRYEIFDEVKKQYGFDKIAVAHNKNDCAETVLFQLFRGSGLTGISGISVKRETIIRPLLCCTREEIEKFLEESGQRFRTDRTNLLEDYSRNKIRLRVLPYVTKEINDRAIEHIVSTANMVSEAQSFIEKNVQIMYDKIVSIENGIYSIKVDELNQLDTIIQKGVIYQTITTIAKRKKDIEQKHIELVIDLTKKEVGKEINLPFGIVASRTYDKILICNKKEQKKEKKEPQEIEFSKKELSKNELPIKKTYQFEEKKYQISLELIENIDRVAEIPKNHCTKWFDYDRINNIILLRHRKSGDYLEINLSGGRKKLKDYFIDKKIPRTVRDDVWLLADGNHIIWILGDRISECYKVTEMTKNILKVSIMEVKEDDR